MQLNGNDSSDEPDDVLESNLENTTENTTENIAENTTENATGDDDSQPNQEPVELPEHFPEDPVVGDGILTFPSFNDKEKAMPAPDLPESVAAQLMTETVGNIQANNRDGRNVSTLAAGVLQGAMARNFDELGTIESRANSGVMATPIASPTTQASRV